MKQNMGNYNTNTAKVLKQSDIMLEAAGAKWSHKKAAYYIAA